MTLTEKLKPHVMAITTAANGGDKGALRIISLYEMHRACPSDPGARALCDAAADDWLRGLSIVTGDKA